MLNHGELKRRQEAGKSSVTDLTPPAPADEGREGGRKKHTAPKKTNVIDDLRGFFFG